MLQDEGWAPLVVRCRAAPDDPALEGSVRVDLGRETAVTGCAAPVRVEAGGEASVDLVVPVGPGRAYEVRLLDGRGRTLATVTPEVPGGLADADEPLGLLVGADGLLALRALPPKGVARLVRIEPERLRRLPDCVLDGLASLVLRADAGSSLRELAGDPPLVERLRRWVERGGTLAVLAGSGPPFWEDGPLAELLPVRAQGGVVDEPLGTFEALIGPLTAPDHLPGTIPLARLARRGEDGAIEGRRGDLLVRRRLGRGRVLVLTFDPDHPALRGAARATGFLAQLVPPRALEPPRPREQALQGLSRAAFAGVAPLQTTAVSLLLAALVLHLLLVGPVAVFLGRRRGPWAGFFAPAGFSLLLAGLLFLAGAATRGEPVARALVWSFRSAGSGQAARTHVSLGLFAGASERFRVELEPGTVPASASRRELALIQLRGTGPLLGCREGQLEAIEPLLVQARGLAQVELRAPAPEEPPPFRVRLNAPAAAGELPMIELAALTPLEEGLCLLAIGRELRLGRAPALAEGARWTFEPERAVALPRGSQALEGDLWGHAPPEQELLAAAALALEDERARAIASTPVGISPSFPAWWVLRLDDPGGAPLRVRRGDGAELPLAVRRVTAWAVEGAP